MLTLSFCGWVGWGGVQSHFRVEIVLSCGWVGVLRKKISVSVKVINLFTKFFIIFKTPWSFFKTFVEPHADLPESICWLIRNIAPAYTDFTNITVDPLPPSLPTTCQPITSVFLPHMALVKNYRLNETNFIAMILKYAAGIGEGNLSSISIFLTISRCFVF